MGTTAIAALSVSTIAEWCQSLRHLCWCFNWKCFAATALAAGRTISGTGEATFTTGAFDGTGNVSGAVTLQLCCNKQVLTGYASGPGVVAARFYLSCNTKIKRILP
jgi:hypothetical protein